MRTAIVHIGMPRTGTTTFQRCLFEHRDALDRLGVLYPELTPSSAATGHLSHQHFGETLDGRRGPAERTELLERLEKTLRRTDADTLVLSYERLILAPRRLRLPERLASLCAAHGFAMTPLVTVKPQDEQVNSQYTWRMQFLREGRTFDRYARTQIGASDLRLDRLVEPWRRACQDRLLATPVRRRNSNREFLPRLLETAGLLARLTPVIGADFWNLVENRSPGPVTVEVARRLQSASAKARFTVPARDVTRFVEDRAHERGFDASSFQGVGAAFRDRIAAAFADSNDAFAAMAWSGKWADIVEAAPPRAVNELARRRLDDVTERAVSDILGRTLATFAG